MTEFEIINQFFKKQTITDRSDVIVSIGDDCAITTLPANHNLAITTDTLIEDIHFLKNTKAEDIGYKALAVNLSDLAAMGATPLWFTLALTLPQADTSWLTSFSQGLFELADKHQVTLIGGDTTKGEKISITIAAYGKVENNHFLKRSGAHIGEAICVSHTLGDAALGLSFLQKKISLPEPLQLFFCEKLNRPEPQIELGKKISQIASSAIDISDGLVGDLGHILEASSVGAIVDVGLLPLSQPMREVISQDEAIVLALTGGDDYQLCFTVSTELLHKLPSDCTVIGTITEKKGLHLIKHNDSYTINKEAYQHFR